MAGSDATGSLMRQSPTAYWIIMSWSSCTTLWQWIMYRPPEAAPVSNCIRAVTDSFSPR